MNLSGFGIRCFKPSAASASHRGHTRRGAVVVLVVVMMVLLLSMAAMTIDLGTLYVTRAELQRAADAAALAGVMDLLDEDVLSGQSYMADEIAAATASAVEYGGMNKVLQGYPAIDPVGDVTVGYLYDPDDPDDVFTTAVDPSLYNSVRVIVRRTAVMNGSVSFRFAPIFGSHSSDLVAEATATFKDGVTGFRVTDDTGPAGLVPFALHVDAWERLITQAFTMGDNYSWDEDTQSVVAGPDGIPELNVYPGAGANQLPPGNFGTIDIGGSNNSTADLSRQIRDGINIDDLAALGGEFSVPTTVDGDTGLSAGIKDDLASIIGQARTIPLFNGVTGTGGVSSFDIEGFGGIRVMDVNLTGSIKKKMVIIQPAYVVDDAAVTGPGSGASYYVYQPVRLTR